ncbi:MAG: CPBP family glutamic-type intramembrane protease [Acidobacteriota bacterium]
MTISYEYKCPNCGTPLVALPPSVCSNCGAQFPAPSQPQSPNKSYNPDLPAWGVGAAIGMWALSVLLIIVLPVFANLIWYAWLRAQGVVLTPETLARNLNIPLFVFATFSAHIFTLLGTYQLVVASGAENFLAALGWHWHPRFRFLQALLSTVLMFGLAILISRVISQLIPHQETDLERLLKASPWAPYLIAGLAVITAPLVEEIIYRGVLYSALRRRFGVRIAVASVSLLFLLVHVPQYLGGWDALLSLGLLSFGLTLVRAYTGSLLPSYTIHLLFNGVQAIAIIVTSLVEK